MINAQQNGFLLNHFPNLDNESVQEDEEDGANDDDSDSEDNESNDSEDDAAPPRPRQPDDPHVEVPRFGEVLPPVLHTQEFRNTVRTHFPTGRFDQAIDQYVAVLEFVTGWLERA